MEANFKNALRLIAGSEGGYSNHPNDPGGPTMKGVTLANYARYCRLKGKTKPGIEALKRITDAEVEEIFRMDYWNRVRGDSLPAGIDYAVADFGFNSGSGQAVKELQRVVTALGHDAKGADGKIGTATLNAVYDAVKQKGADVVIDAYQDKRLRFMQGLKNWSSFKRGWTRRVEEVRERAKEMAHGGSVGLILANEPGTPKADPVETKATSVPGGTSTVVTVGGAIATAATSAGTSLLDRASYSGVEMLPWLVGGFILLTLIGSLVTFFILKNKPKEEGTV